MVLYCAAKQTSKAATAIVVSCRLHQQQQLSVAAAIPWRQDKQQAVVMQSSSSEGRKEGRAIDESTFSPFSLRNDNKRVREMAIASLR